jgi:hypothetical protein
MDPCRAMDINRLLLRLDQIVQFEHLAHEVRLDFGALEVWLVGSSQFDVELFNPSDFSTGLAYLFRKFFWALKSYEEIYFIVELQKFDVFQGWLSIEGHS